MTRQTQNMLYHLLPVAFWLLAIGAIVLWQFIFNSQFSIFNYLPALLALIATMRIRHVPRHTDATEPCFQVGLLLGLASYWLPSIVFLILPVWGWLIYQNLFSLRVLLASLIGWATVAIWIAVLSQFSIVNCAFSIANALPAWFPVAAVQIAYLTSTIVRHNLRVR